MLTHVHKVIHSVVDTFEHGWRSWWSKRGDCQCETVTRRRSRLDLRVWSCVPVRSRALSCDQTLAASCDRTRCLCIWSCWHTLTFACSRARGDQTHRCVRLCVTWRVRLRKIGSGTSLELIWRQETEWSSASGQGSALTRAREDWCDRRVRSLWSCFWSQLNARRFVFLPLESNAQGWTGITRGWRSVTERWAGASGRPELGCSVSPTTLFRGGFYLSPMAGSSSLSWPFVLT
jgi:hypothetical protein